uniref:Col_cuticle_N domain-containing protein n=1 Tax=Heterorhabditis bacteriophora TaxID=37862 RepID=A0A1I7WZR8_HETBA
MVIKLIVAYPYHVLHTILMYKCDENKAPIVETMLKEAECRVCDVASQKTLQQIISDISTAHIAYQQFVNADPKDTRMFTVKKQMNSGWW